LPPLEKGDPPEIKKMNELKEGESFGEIALLKGKFGLRVSFIINVIDLKTATEKYTRLHF